MIAKHRRKSLAIGLPGLGLQLCSYRLIPLLAANDIAPENLSWVALGSEFALLAGTALFIVGLSYYSRAKGYSGALGFLGLLSCAGLLIIALLPDKSLLYIGSSRGKPDARLL
jgi:hypothetical protein